jgi:hypothetical protein
MTFQDSQTKKPLNRVKKLIIVALVVCVQGCRDTTKGKYGVLFNPQRVKIGLPVLPQNWTVFNKGKDCDGHNYVSWNKPFDGKSTPKPCLHHKTVRFNSDTILSEENEYLGNSSYTDIDGTFEEELFITYNFIDVKTEGYSQTKGWECAIKNQASCNKFEWSKMTLQEVDSILMKWKLK